MKKTVLTIVLAALAAGAVQAIKPVRTEGFDKYRNSIKLDLASSAILCPQVEWEYMTDSRFKFGAFVHTYLINRSHFSTQFESQETAPKTVVVYGDKYDVNWANSPGRMYGEIQMNGETHEVRWDRRYTGVMVGPQGRFYLGSKPDRGIYALSKIGFGLFRESFDISCGEYSLEEQRRQSDAIKQARQAAEAAGQSYSQPEWIWSEWKDAGNEKSDFKYAVGAGLGLGVQWWFGKNSQWGFDINSIYKYVYSSVDNENHSMWEWFLGPGLPIDLNASLVYRF
jgi:hypothetical protein